MRCLQYASFGHEVVIPMQASRQQHRPALHGFNSCISRFAGHSCRQHGGNKFVSCRSAASADAQPDQPRAIAADFASRAADASAGQAVSAEGSNSVSNSNVSDPPHDGGNNGFCWLVGAGPGALEHLTVCIPSLPYLRTFCSLDGAQMSQTTPMTVSCTPLLLAHPSMHCWRAGTLAAARGGAADTAGRGCGLRRPWHPGLTASLAMQVQFCQLCTLFFMGCN